MLRRTVQTDPPWASALPWSSVAPPFLQALLTPQRGPHPFTRPGQRGPRRWGSRPHRNSQGREAGGRNRLDSLGPWPFFLLFGSTRGRSGWASTSYLQLARRRMGATLRTVQQRLLVGTPSESQVKACLMQNPP